MKIADWLRGATAVVWDDVVGVFATAKKAIALAPLPTNIKADTTQTLVDAQADLEAVGYLAGGLLTSLAADAVDDATTFFMNSANAVGGAKSFSAFTAAEKTAVITAVTAGQAQLTALKAQLTAGIDVIKVATKTAPPPPPAPAPTSQATNLPQ